MDFTKPENRATFQESVNANLETFSLAMNDEPFKTRIPISMIGEECRRKIWYVFRWVKPAEFDAKQMRVFDAGEWHEQRVKEILRKLGLEISEECSTDGLPLLVSRCNGHLGGKLDGIIPFEAANLLLEVKSANDAEFKRIVKNGVIKEKPKHYSQMCTYCDEYKLDAMLYICLNKNTEEWHVECLEPNAKRAEQMTIKAQAIIDTDMPPGKGNNDATSKMCTGCNFNAICHSGAPAAKNCRSCLNAIAIENMQWKCKHWDAVIPTDAIPVGCDAWESIAR